MKDAPYLLVVFLCECFKVALNVFSIGSLWVIQTFSNHCFFSPLLSTPASNIVKFPSSSSKNFTPWLAQYKH